MSFVFIAQALYSHTHSDYPRYIYLLMPLNLLILNPIGFFVMEIEKRRKIQIEGGVSARNEVKSIIFMVFRGLATNPMVVSTVVGIIGEIRFCSKMLSVDEFCTVFARFQEI